MSSYNFLKDFPSLYAPEFKEVKQGLESFFDTYLERIEDYLFWSYSQATGLRVSHLCHGDKGRERALILYSYFMYLKNIIDLNLNSNSHLNVDAFISSLLTESLVNPRVRSCSKSINNKESFFSEYLQKPLQIASDFSTNRNHSLALFLQGNTKFIKNLTEENKTNAMKKVSSELNSALNNYEQSLKKENRKKLRDEKMGCNYEHKASTEYIKYNFNCFERINKSYFFNDILKFLFKNRIYEALYKILDSKNLLPEFSSSASPFSHSQRSRQSLSE